MENTLFVSNSRLLDAACLLFAQSLFTFTSMQTDVHTQRVSALTAFRIMRLCHNGPFMPTSDSVRRKSGSRPAQRAPSASALFLDSMKSAQILRLFYNPGPCHLPKECSSLLDN